MRGDPLLRTQWWRPRSCRPGRCQQSSESSRWAARGGPHWPSRWGGSWLRRSQDRPWMAPMRHRRIKLKKYYIHLKVQVISKSKLCYKEKIFPVQTAQSPISTKLVGLWHPQTVYIVKLKGVGRERYGCVGYSWIFRSGHQALIIWSILICCLSLGRYESVTLLIILQAFWLICFFCGC